MCGGANTKRALDELYVFIEKGTPDGHEEHFKDASDEFVNVRAGEVIFKIQEVEHPTFKRKGDNLETSMNITLREALLGFEKELKHLDDHTVKIVKNPGQITQPGEVMRIKDEGMPKYGMSSDHGDLLVTFNVNSPEKLDDGQKVMLKQFFKQSLS